MFGVVFVFGEVVYSQGVIDRRPRLVTCDLMTLIHPNNIEADAVAGQRLSACLFL
jgi:hypothetical protein